MSKGAAPLADNPFPARPPDLGPHGPSCPGPELRDGYIAFADRPDPPETGGGVVLIAGRPHLGKSVLAHRCLHHYERAGRLPADLSARPAGDVAGPADCLAVMRAAAGLPGELRAALREARDADPVEAHRDLGRALDGRGFAARLPRPDPSLRPAAIAERVLGCARAAAEANGSVYVFEFPYWEEADWHRVREGIGRSPDAPLVTAVPLEPFSDRELMAFLRARLGGAERLRALLDLDPAVLLRALARQRASISPNNLTWFNVLCHRAFEAAIESRAPRVAVHHYLAAAVRTGAP
ncbi:hypothetical protein HUT06_33350 [Actinomadura sp. NAK00032]|uniref:hypothetical protein n=1 Tax=Actinomadura sp. NAK00032 TaxID=2742128 RepID=UPI0015916D8D|nr:hypothetical protein [Actinomadura sp. NAK00032]QKW38290.1 hypothetical protein HUT06_33350 [Actinomadura sp. NAK00032]